jgi:hypothetical protein
MLSCFRALFRSLGEYLGNPEIRVEIMKLEKLWKLVFETSQLWEMIYGNDLNIAIDVLSFL